MGQFLLYLVRLRSYYLWPYLVSCPAREERATICDLIWAYAHAASAVGTILGRIYMQVPQLHHTHPRAQFKTLTGFSELPFPSSIVEPVVDYKSHGLHNYGVQLYSIISCAPLFLLPLLHTLNPVQLPSLPLLSPLIALPPELASQRLAL